MNKLAWWALGAIVFVGALWYLGTVTTTSQQDTSAGGDDQRIQIKWLVSHQPSEVFERAERVFADELSKRTGGRIELTMMKPEDVGIQHGDIPSAQVLDMLHAGIVQLATDYTVAEGKSAPSLWAWNLPFLFNSYDDVTKALNGPQGTTLLRSLDDAGTNVRALAFTMSGGLRIIASKDKKISKPADIKGLHIATSGGPVAEATLKALGAVPVPMDLEAASSTIDLSDIDGVETTYSRLSEVLSSGSAYTRYLNNTDHSVFLTMILADKKFYDSLSAEDQAALTAAAQAAAQAEREDSIALNAKTESDLAAAGSTITKLTAGEREAFKKATAGVAQTVASLIGADAVMLFTGQATQ